MRALAEFIMRGRTQASVVALIGSWFPLISPASVALVTLRRGPQDGLLILLWALLPAIVTLFMSQMGPLMALATIAGLIATYVVALLLRGSASWPQLLVGLVAISTFAALLLAAVVPDPVQGLTAALGDVMEQMQAQAPEGAVLHTPSEVFVVGLIAYVIAINSLFSLLLARWWQSLLYNPGGFQTEFHQLRLKPGAAIISLLASAYCMAVGGDYQLWGSLFMLPLLLAGIAIVHRFAAAKKVGMQWLVLFYFALILFNPISMVVVVVIAFSDTWLNFRGRLQEKP